MLSGNVILVVANFEVTLSPVVLGEFGCILFKQSGSFILIDISINFSVNLNETPVLLYLAGCLTDKPCYRFLITQGSIGSKIPLISLTPIFRIGLWSNCTAIGSPRHETHKPSCDLPPFKQSSDIMKLRPYTPQWKWSLSLSLPCSCASRFYIIYNISQLTMSYRQHNIF